MTWQDELRRLDEELAAGRLSADEYRQRRDQLLAASNNPNSGAQPVQQPPQQPGGPFPPPFRWDASGPQGNPDATQVVQPGADATQAVPGGQYPNPANPDATQIVPGGMPGADATQVVPGGRYPNPANPDATQVVPGFNPQGGSPDATQVVRSPAAGFPQQPQQGWPQQAPQQGWAAQQQLPNQQGWPQPGGYTDQNASPWGGGDTSGEPGWMRQGPEVFEEGGNGKTGKIIAIVAVIVVLAGIAVGAVFLFNNKSPQANPPASTTGTTQAAASGPIADGLPGRTEPSVSKGIKTFADLTSTQNPLLSQPEVNSFETAGAADTSVLYNDVNGNGFLILVVKAESPDAAKQAAADLHAQQLKFGLAAKTSPVTGATIDGKDNVADSPTVPVLRRVHYSSGNYIVRIEVRGKDAAAADNLLQTVLTKQAAVLKPDAS